MTFQRTPLGLSNQALFYNVDYIVFVESKHAANKSSFDEVFWNGVIETYRPDLKIRVKSVGSKTDLLPIAGNVELGVVDKVIVCLDADFDKYYGLTVKHPRVLYTHGYSWENDIILLTRCIKAIEDACGLCLEGKAIAEDFLKCVKNMSILGKRVGRFDICLQAQDKPLQSKRRLGELISIQAPYAKFDIERILKKLRTLSSSGYKIELFDAQNFEFLRDYHGKTVLFALYHSIVLLADAAGSLASFSYDHFVAALLVAFRKGAACSLLSQHLHHKVQCGGIK